MNYAEGSATNTAVNLATTLNNAANAYPEQVALSCQGESLTFKALQHAALQIAQTLQHKGIDSIAIIAPDHFTSLSMLYGAAYANATITFVNPNLAPPEIDYIVSDSGATLLFTSAHVAQTCEFSLPVVLLDYPSDSSALTADSTVFGTSSATSFGDWCLPHSALAEPTVPDNTHCVLQLYTSGTTGRPKGVQLNDSSLFAIVNNMQQAGEHWYLWQPDDVGISALPFFHIGGLWWATTAIAAGARIEIMPRFIPAAYLEIVATEQVTRLALVPAMLMMVLAEPGAKATDFSRIRHCVYGGSPMPVSLLKRAKKRLSCDFIQIYGLTETGNTAICLRPDDHNHPALLSAAGKPYPGVEVKCIDKAGNTLEAGQHGEICLKSPANMLSYRNLPQATASTLQDGWIHTGDAGYINDDGYLFVRDRIKDMIISAGENIYPAEIEAQFEDFAAVAEAIAIGIPDEQAGEQVKLLVRHSGSANPQLTTEIMAFLQSRLAAHKLPQSIEFVTDFPRTASGKVQRAKLRAPYWEGRTRKI